MQNHSTPHDQLRAGPRDGEDLSAMFARVFDGLTGETMRPEARNCLATDLAGLGDIGAPAQPPVLSLGQGSYTRNYHADPKRPGSITLHAGTDLYHRECGGRITSRCIDEVNEEWTDNWCRTCACEVGEDEITGEVP